jgi:hypothetical protein
MGKRMKSALPKVAHPVLGQPMLWHVASTAAAAGIPIASSWPRREHLIRTVERFGGKVAVQERQLGTGTPPAPACRPSPWAKEVIPRRRPLLRPGTLRALIAARRGGGRLRADRDPARPRRLRPGGAHSRRRRIPDRGRTRRRRLDPAYTGGQLRHVRLRPEVFGTEPPAPHRRQHAAGVLPHRPRRAGAPGGEGSSRWWPETPTRREGSIPAGSSRRPRRSSCGRRSAR